MKYCLLSILLGFSILCTAEELAERLKPFTQIQTWKDRQARPEITRQTLVNAIEMSRAYYLNHQKPAGNFIYSVDIANGEIIDKDNQVRQAGALWGLACLNRDRFTEPSRRALLLGIDYFAKKVTVLPTGEKCLVYGNDEVLSTGTVALFSLALIEFLHGQDIYLDEKVKAKYRELLDIHLAFLRTMEMENGSWSRSYDVPTGFRDTSSSSYYDGEALLAYCKAARYLGYTNLLPRINAALPKLIEKYTVESWGPDGDPAETKGFYQWGSMAMAEYVEAGWTPHAELAEDASAALAHWLVLENDIVHRQGNTAYSVEGLIAAWRIAGHTGNQEMQDKLRRCSMEIMSSLMTWQYKGPFMEWNPLLKSLKKAAPAAEGGICGAKDSTVVRIDIQQHQTHAMLLMLHYFFDKEQKTR